MRILQTKAYWALVLVITACAVAAEGSTWEKDYAKALSASKASGHPIVVLLDGVANPKSMKDTVASLEQSDDFRTVSRKFVLVQVEGFKISQIRELDWCTKESEPPVAAIVDLDGKPVKTYTELPAADDMAQDMAQAFADITLDKADYTAAAGDDKSAVAMYWDVLTVKPPLPAAERARRALSEAGRRGRLKITAVEPMLEAHEFLKARRYLEDINSSYAGTEAATAAAERIEEMTKDSSIAAEIAAQEREEEAAKTLEKARKAAADGNAEDARILYSKVINVYGDTEAAKIASQESAQSRKASAGKAAADPGKMKQDCDNWMALASTAQANDHQTEAIKWYKKIVDTYPGSSYADEANKKLKELK